MVFWPGRQKPFMIFPRLALRTTEDNRDKTARVVCRS